MKITMVKVKRSTKNDLLILKVERNLKSMNDVIEELIISEQLKMVECIRWNKTTCVVDEMVKKDRKGEHIKND